MYCRLYRSSDFSACSGLLGRGLTIPRTLREALPSIWRRLFIAGQVHGGVVIDPNAPGPESIASFAMCVFVDEGFVTNYLGAPSPYPSTLVYERILADRSPILPMKDVAAANSSGTLNLLILHFGLRHPPESERGLAAIAVSHSGFRLFFVGYRIGRVLQEAYGPEQLPFFTAGGFFLKSDYRKYFERHGHAAPAEELHPYLMGLYRSDPESRYPGTGLSYLFQHADPRFGFSAGEQRVLLHAVMDESDDTISDALSISHDAVKKTWRRIHERVMAVMPDLYGEDAEIDATRGKERRRRLLHYLRYHLEELRPFVGRRQTRAS